MMLNWSISELSNNHVCFLTFPTSHYLLPSASLCHPSVTMPTQPFINTVYHDICSIIHIHCLQM